MTNCMYDCVVVILTLLLSRSQGVERNVYSSNKDTKNQWSFCCAFELCMFYPHRAKRATSTENLTSEFINEYILMSR